MPNYQAIYNVYKQEFDDGTLDMTPYVCDMIDNELRRHFLLNFIQRLGTDSWVAQDKFQFALILTYFHVDYKDYLHEVPDETYYPSCIDFDTQFYSGPFGRLSFTPNITPLTKRSEPVKKAIMDIL